MVEELTGSRDRTGTPGVQRHRGRFLTSLLSAPGVTCLAEPWVSACWPTPARLRPCPSTQWTSGFPFLLQSWVARVPLAPVLQASPGDDSQSCAKVIPVGQVWLVPLQTALRGEVGPSFHPGGDPGLGSLSNAPGGSARVEQVKPRRSDANEVK